MKSLLFAVKDIKVGTFGNPFHEKDFVNAQRSFSVAVNQEGSQLNSFPEDFELWNIGQFDNDKGIFINKQHALVVNGLNVINRINPPTGRQLNLVDEFKKVKEKEDDGIKKA